jgi:hypothetical protein
VCTIERRQQRTPAYARGRAASAAEEADLSGVDGGRVESTRRGLREFWDEKRNDIRECLA